MHQHLNKECFLITEQKTEWKFDKRFQKYLTFNMMDIFSMKTLSRPIASNGKKRPLKG